VTVKNCTVDESMTVKISRDAKHVIMDRPSIRSSPLIHMQCGAMPCTPWKTKC
jgi:hypothetical protein